MIGFFLQPCFRALLSATLLLLQEVYPKVVQERLGHAHIGITLDTYSHVLSTMQHAAAVKLDQLFEMAQAHVTAEQARSTAAATDSTSDIAARAEVEAGDERDWLQLGYKPPETPFSIAGEKGPEIPKAALSGNSPAQL